MTLISHSAGWEVHIPKKYACVKVNDQDRAQKSEATRVNKDEQYHRLLVYKGDELVGDSG
jgi:hypothetical protein